MASCSLGPMRISLWRGESGGHGRFTQSSACPVLIGFFGKAIVGSIVTDTASLATAHYRSRPNHSDHRTCVTDWPHRPHWAALRETGWPLPHPLPPLLSLAAEYKIASAAE